MAHARLRTRLQRVQEQSTRDPYCGTKNWAKGNLEPPHSPRWSPIPAIHIRKAHCSVDEPHVGVQDTTSAWRGRTRASVHNMYAHGIGRSRMGRSVRHSPWTAGCYPSGGARHAPEDEHTQQGSPAQVSAQRQCVNAAAPAKPQRAGLVHGVCYSSGRTGGRERCRGIREEGQRIGIERAKGYAPGKRVARVQPGRGRSQRAWRVNTCNTDWRHTLLGVYGAEAEHDVPGFP
ncbi:hypothetical protein DFH09DRAFT_1088096 [Mycena vulgaris]|nr:hypothetical protein DFH09DRAFT_1088096 [Mycena vulgaris]